VGSIDGGPLTDLPDDLTPQGTVNNIPEGTDMVVVVDPEVPLALPQTGGLMTFATPAALALAVLIGLYAATFIKKRRSKAE
jgi:LPXTG-motif cell wall-anchored protein